jgi:hypothetical protein
MSNYETELYVIPKHHTKQLNIRFSSTSYHHKIGSVVVAETVTNIYINPKQTHKITIKNQYNYKFKTFKKFKDEQK